MNIYYLQIDLWPLFVLLFLSCWCCWFKSTSEGGNDTFYVVIEVPFNILADTYIGLFVPKGRRSGQKTRKAILFGIA
jgi:hypothetical protein